MPTSFDPYHKWLGILPKDQPPHHYRLLGLEPFEADPQVIEAAAERQLSFLRKYQSGAHANECQKLLNEVTRARLCLLKPAAKADYDSELRTKLDGPALALEIETGSQNQNTVQRNNQLLIPAVAGGVVIVLVVVAFIALRGGGKVEQIATNGTPGEIKIAKSQDETVANAKQADGVTGKSKAKQQQANAAGQIDILPLLAAEHIIKGRWKIDSNRLESLGAEQFARITLPLEVPPEYTIHIEGTRLEHPDAPLKTLGVGLVAGQHDFLFAMETHAPKGSSGLQVLDGRIWDQNQTTLPGSFITTGRPFELDVIVRRDGVESRINGRTIVDWHGDFSRLQQDANWASPEPQRLFLAAASKHVFHRVTLGPPLPQRKLPGSDLKVGESVELLRFVDLKQDVWHGAWLKEGLAMKNSPDMPTSRFSVPFQAPEEYELVADIESERPEEFYLGLPFQKGHVGMGLGGGGGQISLLVPELGTQDVPGLYRRGPVFEAARSKVTTSVRKNHLVVKVGKTTIFDWRGDPRRFRAWSSWATPGNRVTVGTNAVAYQIHSLVLTRLPESPNIFPAPVQSSDGNLLTNVNIDRDTAMGIWQDSAGKLTSTEAVPSAMRFPGRLPADYEFRVVLQRKAKKDVSCLSIPVAGRSVMIALDGYGGTVSGIEWFEGRRSYENSTSIRPPSPHLPLGQPRILQGRVEGKHLRVELDGEKLWDLDVPETLIDPAWEMRPGWLTPEERLQMYVSAWYSGIEVHDARFRPLDKDSPAFPPFDLAAIAKPSNENVAIPPTTPPPVSVTDPKAPLVAAGLLTTGTTPLPDSAAQEVARKKLLEVFADDLSKAKKEPEKIALAARLEQVADEYQADPAAKYVCLDEARKLAVDGGDLPRVLSVIDALSSEFQLDLVELKVTSFKNLAPKLKGPQANKELIDALLPLVDQWQKTESTPQALELASLASQAAVKVKDKAVLTEVTEIRKEAQAIADEYEIADKARETLKTTPEDASARLTWGRWLCLHRNDWQEGLKILQGSSDATLKDLAERDIRNPTETSEMLELGGGWLRYAKSGKDHQLAEFAERALFWFQKAEAQSTGLAKSRVEMLMEDAVDIRDWNSPMRGLLEQVSKKVSQQKFTKSDETRHDSGDPFQDMPAQGGVLVGFNCTVSNWAQYTVIKGLQPVYATKSGLRAGKWHGLEEGMRVEVRARPGYAVNGIASQVGAAVDIMKLSFAKVTKTGLDPKRTYFSPQMGNQEKPGGPFVLTSGSQPIIGIFGHADDFVRGFGMLIAR